MEDLLLHNAGFARQVNPVATLDIKYQIREGRHTALWLTNTALKPADSEPLMRFGYHLDGPHGFDALSRPLSSTSLIIVDARGAPAGTLTTLDEALAQCCQHKVVILNFDQLDKEADALLKARAHILCDPAGHDWQILLEEVAITPETLQAGLSEAQRLQRLLEEGTRLAERLASRDTLDEHVAPIEKIPLSAARVRAFIRTRRLREQLFPQGLFADPAWDILLDLFATELNGGQVSISSLCIAAAVPPTTALRWIKIVEETGLIERSCDPRDKRRNWIKLSAAGQKKMRDYFANIESAGLPFG
jgi:hypothetical protein